MGKRMLYMAVITVFAVFVVVFVANQMTAKRHQGHITGSSHDRFPVWSPDGQKIAFLSVRRTYDKNVAVNPNELWMVNAEGSGERVLVARNGSSSVEPGLCWLPDSRSLLCIVGSWQGDKMWRVYLDGAKREIPLPQGWIEEFALSADGQKIAFVVGNSELQVARISGLSSRRLASAYSIDDITWSPDSCNVYYRRGDRRSGFDIWRTRSDGSETARVTNTAAVEWGPAFSPDGKRIVYGESGCLFITDVSSFGPRKLISNARFGGWLHGGEYAVVLSPRSMRTANGGGRTWSEPFVIDLDGKVLKQSRRFSKQMIGRFSYSIAPDGIRYAYSSTNGIWIDRIEQQLTH